MLPGEQTLPLNYSSDSAKFIFDNRTQEFGQIRTIMGTKSGWNTTEIKEEYG
jgi:hypothetical protein